MIEIVCVSDGINLSDFCDYEVIINGEVIGAFKHRYTDGHAQCLKKAYEAVEKMKWGNAHQLITEAGKYISSKETDF